MLFRLTSSNLLFADVSRQLVAEHSGFVSCERRTEPKCHRSQQGFALCCISISSFTCKRASFQAPARWTSCSKSCGTGWQAQSLQLPWIGFQGSMSPSQQAGRGPLSAEERFGFLRVWQGFSTVLRLQSHSPSIHAGIFRRKLVEPARVPHQARMRRVIQEAMFGGRPCAPAAVSGTRSGFWSGGSNKSGCFCGMGSDRDAWLPRTLEPPILKLPAFGRIPGALNSLTLNPDTVHCC